ncbi:hypothetical protein DK419_13225 [Methylobacterium terrae]|uniref:Uncharacterized protein n=2 Tax=Methylobacterium terrae TaxID=2202827 RepID=A0A2U8WNS2_9HYPH|nr:hypothetical protein DK419_13225 [Methylobacterium terrae]
MIDHDGEVAHGSPGPAREFLARTAAAARVQASLVETYAEIGDDVGLLYASRCMAAYLRATVAGIEELERTRAALMLHRTAEAIGPPAERSQEDRR